MVFVQGKGTIAQISIDLYIEDEDLVYAILDYYEKKISKKIISKNRAGMIDYVDKYSDFMKAVDEAIMEWHGNGTEEDHPIE